MNTSASSTKALQLGLAVIAFAILIPLGIWVYTLLSYKQINGKVLIVQRDADVKKLALIQIGIVEATDVARWKESVQEKLREAITAIHEFQKEAATEEAEITKIGEKRVSNAADCISRTEEAIEVSRKIWLIDRSSKRLRLRISELLNRGVIPRNLDVIELTKNDNWQDTYRLLSESSLPEARHIHEIAVNDFTRTLESHKANYRKKLLSMRDALDSLIPQPTVKSLPKDFKVRAHDVTDDTGSFTLNVPPGEYYIFAEGNRTVFSTTEHYFWAHPISVPSQESEKCLIGNLNLNGESTLKDDLWHELRRAILEQKRSIQP